MASCPDCGADITHAKTVGGDNVPLEKYTDSTGDRRWRIIGFSPLTVEPVAPANPIDAYPDHRVDCPGHDNGLG